MGVGRNLSYKKDLFLRNKGFSSINHLPGGDDDLFINMVANKRNTRVVIDPEAFTLSEPKKTFGDWMKQKNRHYTSGKFYKPKNKLLLGTYSSSHFLFYPLFIVALCVYDWRLVLGVFLTRLLIQGVVYFKAMKKLQENDLFAWWLLLDLWMCLYYLIFLPALWKKPRPAWR